MPRVLVIDDEKTIIKMLELALTRVGFEVDVASNGIDGIHKYRENHFDVVITDMRMPGKNGSGVVRDIRESDRHKTPVIGMSGTPWELMHDEFDAVLPKPFSLMTLVSTVKKFCYSTV